LTCAGMAATTVVHWLAQDQVRNQGTARQHALQLLLLLLLLLTVQPRYSLALGLVCISSVEQIRIAAIRQCPGLSCTA
jgi:hypothetical protein